MKFCASLAFTDPRDYCELAVLAEESGWDGLVLSDHVVLPRDIASRYPYSADGRPPFDAADPWPDAWVAIAAMGAVTSRLHFLTGVYVVPMRHPFHLAKALGTASVMTGGRVSLGMGLGWMREEFELLGEDFATRAARAEEMVEVMRKLWTGESVEHHGRFYDFGPLVMRPALDAPVPIVVGGASEPAFRRVGRLGDGWMPHALSTADAAAGIARIREHRAACGRADAPLTAIVPLIDAFDPDAFRRAEDVGVTHALLAPWHPSRALADKRDGLRRFGEQVIAAMR